MLGDKRKRATGDRVERNGQAKPTTEPTGTIAPWPDPLPLGSNAVPPPFPLEVLPPWLGNWAECLANATQTPRDLAAMLGLTIAAAGIAGKARVVVRPGWAEPVNLFTAVALASGERKTAVYQEALSPVQRLERELRENSAKDIAEKQSQKRVLEKRLKTAEEKAAKAKDSGERAALSEESRRLAAELAAFVVPPEPTLYCDDITPEKLTNLLAVPGGRMLQASDEGTAFELAKGRYSESPHFDVYLKGHAGSPLRSNRVSRDKDEQDEPALSAALAVQPDVIRGLAELATMPTRGFLARWNYAIPSSIVGSRTVAPDPMPDEVRQRYHDSMTAMWNTAGTVDDKGRPAPFLLGFSPGADEAMREFERWLEPQLADGEPLSWLAGWANKLAGGCARIAGVLHVAEMREPWVPTISDATASAAIRLGREYLLPHARIAFGLMGADAAVEDAQRILRWLTKPANRENVKNVKGVYSLQVSLHAIRSGVFGGSRDGKEVLRAVELLIQHGYLRDITPADQSGPWNTQRRLYAVHPRLEENARG
jgi:hypothetical protein